MRDRIFIAVGASFALLAVLQELVPAFTRSRVSFFGSTEYSRMHDGDIFWFAVIFYSLLTLGMLAAVLPVVLGYTSNEEKPNKAPEPTTTSVMPAAKQPSRRP